MTIDEQHRADGVFEGGGVKGIAFAGALAVTEKEAGVREWVNVAGTSAGSIVAALLAAGYDAAGMQKILADAHYRRFADCGPGGMWLGGMANAIMRLRGMAPGKYFSEWMSEQLAASPLAKELGKSVLTFADVKRRDLPPRSELPDTPRDWIDGFDEADVIDGETVGGKQQRQHAPGDAIVQIVDESRLADAEHRARCAVSRHRGRRRM